MNIHLYNRTFTLCYYVSFTTDINKTNRYLGIIFAEKNALNQFGRNRSIHISKKYLVKIQIPA